MSFDPKTQAEKIQTDIYRKMSPARKWQEAWKLRETAWALKRAGVRAQHPEWTAEQVEKKIKEIFLYAST